MLIAWAELGHVRWRILLVRGRRQLGVWREVMGHGWWSGYYASDVEHDEQQG
jgi:hypothetical protein